MGVDVHAWFRLEILWQSSKMTGRDVGPVVHVAYAEIAAPLRGRQPKLMRRLVCEMIREAMDLGRGRASLVAIDPADDAHGVKRALARRPEATPTVDYPWAYLVPWSRLPDLEKLYCRG